VSEINLLAEKFLREYMSKNALVEFHRVVCPAKRYEVHDAHETAEEFLEQVQSLQNKGHVDSEQRIEVTEPSSVIILRKGRPLLFLAGFRHRDSKPVWCYDARLAAAVSADKAEEFVKALRSCGVETFTMPAPEPNKGSL
jgi:hypothetical protein